MGDLNSLIADLHNAMEKRDIESEKEILFDLSRYYYDEGNFLKSKRFLEQIEDIDDRYLELNYFFALIELNLNEEKKAYDYLKKELRINPKNDKAKLLLSKLKINSNVPLITILLIFFNFMTFFYVYPMIGFSELLKFALNQFNDTFFTAVTSLFFHYNIYHFGFNMILLLFFGLYLEKYIGSFKFLLIFFMSGLVGNFFQYLFYSDSFVLGASGGIFGILGAILMREPFLNIRVFGVFKVPIIMFMGFFFSIQYILSSYLYTEGFYAGDISHVFGLFLGIFFMGIYYNETIIVFYNWLIISLGFWFVILFGNDIYSMILGVMNLSVIIFDIFMVFLGIILIIYSYVSLKNSYLGGFDK